MYLQIKKVKLIPNQYGNNIEISMVGLHEDDGTYIKWVKLDGSILKALTNTKIEYNGQG